MMLRDRRLIHALVTTVIAGLVGAMSTAACTSVAGLSTGGNDDAGALTDASPETGATDAGSAADVTTSVPEAAPPTYCASLPGTHDLCDDFDDGPLGARWSGKQQIGGTLDLVTGGVSAPNALAVNAKVTATKLTLEKEIEKPVKAMICELDVRVAQFGLPRASIIKLDFVSAETSQYYLLVDVSTTASSVSEYKEYAGGAASQSAEPLAVPPLGAWRHVRFDAVFVPPPVGVTTKRLLVSVDGVAAATLDLQPPNSITRARFKIGVENGLDGPTNDWKVHFDNVVCDVR